MGRGAPPSWRAVADALAARMSLHAHCGAHPRLSDAAPDCPFCRDRDAYQMWVAKSGTRHVRATTDGPTIDVLSDAQEHFRNQRNGRLAANDGAGS